MGQQKILEFAEKAGRTKVSNEFWGICQDTLRDNGVTGLGYGIIPYTSDAKVNGYSQADIF